MWQRKSCVVGLCGMVGAFLVVSLSARAAEIALEAELANSIVEPMVANVPADVKAWGPDIDEPSRGKFVWAPGAPVTGGPNDGKGEMRFDVQIPEAGTYAIWGRVIAWDGNSDSFWVTFLPADPDENPQRTNNTQFRWSVAQGGTWHWDRINQWLDGGTFDRQWQLPAGKATLYIRTREDATMIDCLFITTNLAADEASVAPRLPTDADVALQMGKPTSVEPKGKLATTWGALRTR